MRNPNKIKHFYHPINVTKKTKRSVYLARKEVEKKNTFTNLHESKVVALWLLMFINDYENGRFKTPELQELFEQGEFSNDVSEQVNCYIPEINKGKIQEIDNYFGEKKQITFNRIMSAIYILPELLKFRGGGESSVRQLFTLTAQDAYNDSRLKVFERIANIKL